MPYEIIELGDRVTVKGEGKIGTVVGIGNPNNPHAHFFVRFGRGEPVWYSRDELKLTEKGGRAQDQEVV